MLASTAAEDERVVAAATLAAAEEQLQSLTARHAGTFVQAERRARSFQEGLQDLLQQLSSCTANIPVIDENTSQKISDLSEQHRIRRRTLLQHGSLLELLELPTLMDACVRSALYEEALQIAAFANTLQRRHPDSKQQQQQQQPSLTAVHAVIAQIRSRQVDLRWHLLQRLRHSVTMPECLETVTSVRRLHQIELEERTAAPGLERAHAALEYQLQIDFLEARDVWVEQPTAASEPTAAAADGSGRPTSSRMLQQSSGGTMGEEALLDTIERYRTRMFEVVTQFNAIFRANASAATNTNATTGESATTTLLSLWMTRRVQRFLQLLQSQLLLQQQQQSQRHLDAADLRDVLEASVFFATSLGRLGADFTPQLAPIFEPALVQIVTQYWKDGVAQLHETLTICRDAGVASPLTADIPEDDSAAPEQQPQDGMLTTAIPLDQPQPAPKKLLALPPLARLVNAVLQGLNELRRCLLPTVFPTLRRRLEQDVLQTVRQLLLTHERAVAIPGLVGEAVRLRESALALREMLAQCVEPYLQGSLEAAVGNATLARQYHQTVLDYCLQQQHQQQQQQLMANAKQQQQQQQQEDLDTGAGRADNEEDQSSFHDEEEKNGTKANAQQGEDSIQQGVSSAEATPAKEENDSEPGEKMVMADDSDDAKE